MIGNRMALGGLAVALSLHSLQSSAATSADIMENCEPLLEAVTSRLEQRKAKAAIEAGAITAGGTLSEAACIDSLFDMEFDAFLTDATLTSIAGTAISKLSSQFKDSLQSMVCDFSDDLKSQTDEFLTCTASLSVNLSGGQLPTVDLDSCVGTGLDGYDFSFSQSVGEGDAISGRWSDSIPNNSTESDSAKNILNQVQDSIDQLESLKGGN